MEIHIREPTHRRTKTIFEDREKILQKTRKYIFSLICFHLYRKENGIGDKSAEEHLENLKTTRDANFGLGLSEYIKNSSIHMVNPLVPL
jgi:hypothetical protein